MLLDLVAALGPWSWVLFGVILLGAEILVPGFFLIWIGLAALAVGLLSLLLWNAGFWTWQVQVLLFLALAIASAIGGRALMRREELSDEPLLNRRTAQLVGRIATLEQPMVDGRGRIRIDDTTWRVTGPDLPAGTRVRVVAAEGGQLRVEKYPSSG
jgi:membrane protein implicated in regulation of membrane protease activity